MSNQYEEWLQRAIDKLPEITEERDRFKVPVPVVFLEGKTTVVENFVAIADMLNRSHDHLLKNLLRELGTAGKVEGNRAVFQGRFSPETIKEHIKSYVEEYVLCSECGKPDTKLVRTDRVLMLKCEACGAHRPVRKRRAISEDVHKGLSTGDEIEIMIVSTGRKGDGIARHQNYTVFVPGAREGEQINVVVKKVSGTLVFAERID